MPAAELVRWQAYDRLFAIGPEATNGLLARLVSYLHNYLHAQSPATPFDFYGWAGDAEEPDANE